MLYGLNLSTRRLTEPEREAMQWVKENTSKDSEFLVISGEQTAFCDLTGEWFPALTERRSLSTVQGNEWLLGNNFAENLAQIQSLQGCIDEELACLDKNSAQFAFDYVYISVSSPTKNCEASNSSSRATRGLIISMENAERYSVVFRSEKAVLFEKK